MKLQNELTGKYRGNIGGSRIYRVKRGHWQVQNPARQHQSHFDGTLREIERALKGSFVKMV